jgi:integrase
LALTVTEVKNAKPKDKPYRLFDGGGLYLEIAPSGGKLWRMKYRFAGKEKRLAFGVFPDVSLAEARERREQARKLLAKGQDPGQAKKQEKAAAEAQTETFELVAREWFAKQKPTWAASHSARLMARLERLVFPFVGALPVKDLGAPDLLALGRRIEARGTVDTAHRVVQIVGQIMRYAVATGRAERNPSADLRGALAPVKAKHFASLTDPRDVAKLLRVVEEYQGSYVVRCALRLAPLIFVRPGELRRAEWPELDLDGAEWRIPAEKMKMKVQHIVPLSKQAVAILREIHPLTGSGKYVFPGLRPGRTLSENTLNAALRNLGFAKDEMTSHGFRAMASTILHEQGWSSDVIERQLAHKDRNKVRAAYNHAEHLPERRRMMQAWADYLDAIKVGAKVIPMHQAER